MSYAVLGTAPASLVASFDQYAIDPEGAYWSKVLDVQTKEIIKGSVACNDHVGKKDAKLASDWLIDVCKEGKFPQTTKDVGGCIYLSDKELPVDFNLGSGLTKGLKFEPIDCPKISLPSMLPETEEDPPNALIGGILVAGVLTVLGVYGYQEGWFGKKAAA